MSQIIEFLKTTGFYMMFSNFLEDTYINGVFYVAGWKSLTMILVSIVLLWLAIKKQFEPLLLIGIAMGMLLTNLPAAEMYHGELFQGGHVNWELFAGATVFNSVDFNPEILSMGAIQVLETGDVIVGQLMLGHLNVSGFELVPDMIINAQGALCDSAGKILCENVSIVVDLQGALFENGVLYWGDTVIANNAYTVAAGLIDYLYLGVKLGIYPCLIFVGIGAMTDFGPLISNPKSLLLGAAAQIGIFITFICCATFLGFSQEAAASIGIIGGADGPTAIFTTSKLYPDLLGPIAVAAYSYMALVPVIQPPIMKLLTTKKERMIVMKPLRQVSKTEKIVFPIAVTIFVALLVPSATPLVGCLMLGNLWKESGVAERLCQTAQNELMNIVTIFLGISVGATATAQAFLSAQTLKILFMGIAAFAVGTAGGVLLAKFMNLFSKEKINPLIGSAGVSAVPMAARVSQSVGQKENPSNFLLMHAMGPNVAGVIGSAIAAGVLISLFS